MIAKFVANGILSVVLTLISIAVFVLTDFSAFGGKINPQVWAFPSVMALAFPYLGLTTLILTAIALVRKQILTAILGGVSILICLPALSSVFPMHLSKKAEPGEKTFTILSWNILHCADLERGPGEGNRSVDFIISSGADIVVCQELCGITPEIIPYMTEQQYETLRKIYPYHATTICYSETQILSKYPVRIISGMPQDKLGNQRRYFIYQFNVDGLELLVGNCHLSSYALTSDDKEVLEQVKDMKSAKESTEQFKATIYDKLKGAFRLRAQNAQSILDEVEDSPLPIIMCGDFNDVPNSWVLNQLEKAGFKSAFQQTAFWPTYTYNAHRMYFQIDHFLYRGPLRALNWKRGNLRTSDHYPIMATFAFTSDRFKAPKDL